MAPYGYRVYAHFKDKQVVSQAGIDEKADGLNVWQTGIRRKRRKRAKNEDASDIDNWQG